MYEVNIKKRRLSGYNTKGKTKKVVKRKQGLFLDYASSSDGEDDVLLVTPGEELDTEEEDEDEDTDNEWYTSSDGA